MKVPGETAPGLSGEAGYVGRWRPSSVTPQAASFARAVVAAAGPHGRERAKNLLWAAGKLADYGIGLGLDPVPQVLLHPSVIERFTVHAPGLTGVTGGRCGPACGSWPAGWSRRSPRRMHRCPASAPRRLIARPRSGATSRWPPRSPPSRGG
jgi:hypothetical protein